MAESHASATLVFVRHGQARAPDGVSLGRETPLSPLGQRQAEALASELAAAGPTGALYTSPLPRAAETAACVAQRLGLTPIPDARLVEFELGTMPVETILELPHLLIWRPEHRGADGETLQEFSRRVAAFCAEIASERLGERAVVVCHAGTIDAALRWFLGLRPATPWQHEFELPNASITEVEFWPRGRVVGGARRYATLRRVGHTAHLGDLWSDL